MEGRGSAGAKHPCASVCHPPLLAATQATHGQRPGEGAMTHHSHGAAFDSEDDEASVLPAIERTTVRASARPRDISRCATLNLQQTGLKAAKGETMRVRVSEHCVNLRSLQIASSTRDYSRHQAEVGRRARQQSFCPRSHTLVQRARLRAFSHKDPLEWPTSHSCLVLLW
jgi:hypothetical protein